MQKENPSQLTKRCRSCAYYCALGDMVQDRRLSDGYATICKACLRAANSRRIAADVASHNAQRRSRYANDPRPQMLSNAKQRAARRGVAFTITVDDIVIPTHCPALGTPLVRGSGAPQDDSPSLDCVVPALGYVPGNVEVLSQLANRIKSNAQPEQVLAVGLYLTAKRKSLTAN